MRGETPALTVPPSREGTELWARSAPVAHIRGVSEPASESPAGRGTHGSRSPNGDLNRVCRDRGPHHAQRAAKGRSVQRVNRDPTTKEEGCSRGGPPSERLRPGDDEPSASKPSRTKVATESPHRSLLLVPPVRHCLLPLTPSGSAPPRLRNRTTTTLVCGPCTSGSVGLEPAGGLGSNRRVCRTRGPSVEVRCAGWSVGWVEETAAYRRYQQEAPMRALGGDFGTAWFACLGELRSPLVRLPPSSFLLVGAQFTLGRFAPYWLCRRFRPRSRTPRWALCRGAKQLVGERATRPAGDCARRLATPACDRGTWSAPRPELARAVSRRVSPFAIRTRRS